MPSAFSGLTHAAASPISIQFGPATPDTAPPIGHSADATARGGASSHNPAASGRDGCVATGLSTATPRGSILTSDEAGAAYFAVADPYNAAIDRAEAQYGARLSLKDHQQYWALIAKADQAFIDGLKEIAFPPDIQPAATVLIKADEAFQQRAVVASKSRSIAEVISLSAVANDASEVVADKAALLRDALGLEPYAG